MINHHSRRVFTVGGQGANLGRGSDFKTLTAAMTAMAAIGGWTATNRALLIVEAATNEPGSVTPQPFVDVHFQASGRIGGSVVFSIANYDGNWSADNAAQPHITAGINVTGSITVLNLFRINSSNAGGINSSNAGGAALSVAFGAASPLVANINAVECVFTSGITNGLLMFGPNVTFNATRCTSTNTVNALNLAASGNIAYCIFTSTADLGINANFIQPLAGGVANVDFCNFSGFATGAIGVVTFAVNSTQGIGRLRNSIVQASAASNSVLFWQNGITTNNRILNNTVIAFAAGQVGMNAVVATPTIRAHNNAVRGTVGANWGNQALALNGSNVIVS